MSKKFMGSLIIIMAIAMTFSSMSFALGALDQVDYEALLGPNGWQGFYITSADRSVANVKVDIAMSADTNWFAKIPGFGVKGTNFDEWDYSGSTIGNDSYAGMYIHAGQAKSAATGETRDMGLMFTAPKAGTFSFVFKGIVSDADSDGVKLLVYKNDFTTALHDSVVASTAVDVKIDDISLASGEKLYVLFNKNNTITDDTLTINDMSVLFTSPLIFPTINVKKAVTVGETFSQYFNYVNDAEVTAFWKPFYIKDGVYTDLVKHPTDAKYIIPDQTDINQYACIWDDDLNNKATAVQPADGFLLGDYFVVPANGTVKIECNFWYPNNPGTNPASADGIGIRIYKNDAETGISTLIREREIFDFANASGEDGKDLNLSDISVKEGDKIVFLYDKNGTPWSDATYVNKKQVVYTAIEAVPTSSESSSNESSTTDNESPTTGDNFGIFAIIALLAVSSIAITKKVRA